eukprot:5395543-Karenia_brevis.AAC.1
MMMMMTMTMMMMICADDDDDDDDDDASSFVACHTDLRSLRSLRLEPHHNVLQLCGMPHGPPLTPLDPAGTLSQCPAALWHATRTSAHCARSGWNFIT